MLEHIDLDRHLSHAEYDEVLPALQRRLYDLERACWHEGIPSIVLFEGWDAAGKGGCIATLTERLDARGFKLHHINPPRTFEREHPWLWRFWLKVPNRGEMVILDRSWYRHVLDDHVDGDVSSQQLDYALRDIRDFERMLTDDRTVLVKFFLHITKKEQKRRFKKIEADPLECWRVTKDDWRRRRNYDEFSAAVERAIEATETESAPWTLVEATSKWWARRKVFETLITALEYALGDLAPHYEAPPESKQHDADLRAAMATLEAGKGEG